MFPVSETTAGLWAAGGEVAFYLHNVTMFSERHGLGGTLHLVLTPPVPMGTGNLAGQPVPGLTIRTVKNFFLLSNLKLFLFSLKPRPRPTTTFPDQESLPSFPSASLQGPASSSSTRRQAAAPRDSLHANWAISSRRKNQMTIFFYPSLESVWLWKVAA